MKPKSWFLIFLLFFIALCLPIIIIDPYFHYHKPLKSLFYPLNNQRSQNNGIIKHFDYDGIITGTSMTENFKKTEADKLFNANFIKVPFSGGFYKEINDNIKVGLEHNKNLKTVIRAIDMFYILYDKNAMRTDLGEYPVHLYDDNPFNDVKYIFNKQLFLNLRIPIKNKIFKNQKGGFTDFDRYSYWMPHYTFGKTAVLKDRIEFKEPTQINSLTQKELQTILESVTQNITSLTKENPQCTFYYFFPPYSAAWWGRNYEAGDIEKQIEIEKTAIEAILECENIKLFSFNNEFEITTNLNNYKDDVHYGEWINTLMLEYMAQDKCLLTKENYFSYLEKEKEFYSTFDYNSLFDQADEEDRPCDLQ